ncbi:GNAT family N-acetyltransferase [Streptomyces sp. NPDC006733]|uniref:GNAT family N-acetyltransferase n=1 Tax=Streptomyces sp. NPDC006733 TaxID=3155460 RepID=UPI00340F94A0
MTPTAHRAATIHAPLSDGRTVEIRPAGRTPVLRWYEGMSSENQRLRFFGVSRRSGPQAADRPCSGPRRGHHALIARCDGEVVGVAEYESGADAASAEIALAVADAFHHCGAGTLLLEHLVHAARQDGITSFTADAPAENHLMLKVVADLGLRTTRRFAGTEVRRPGRAFCPRRTSP